MTLAQLQLPLAIPEGTFGHWRCGRGGILVPIGLVVALVGLWKGGCKISKQLDKRLAGQVSGDSEVDFTLDSRLYTDIYTGR